MISPLGYWEANFMRPPWHSTSRPGSLRSQILSGLRGLSHKGDEKQENAEC